MGRRNLIILIILSSLMGWQACGQTGDLYWPEDEQVDVDNEETDEQGP